MYQNNTPQYEMMPKAVQSRAEEKTKDLGAIVDVPKKPYISPARATSHKNYTQPKIDELDNLASLPKYDPEAMKGLPEGKYDSGEAGQPEQLNYTRESFQLESKDMKLSYTRETMQINYAQPGADYAQPGKATSEKSYSKAA